jgi:hypothetical protein
MVSLAEVIVGATTDQQAQALPVARPDDEFAYRGEVLAGVTFGSSGSIAGDVILGDASSFLAAVGDALLGGVVFDDDSADAIREARTRR